MGDKRDELRQRDKEKGGMYRRQRERGNVRETRGMN